MLFIQTIQGKLGNVQLVLGIGNQLRIGRNLLIGIFNLIVKKSEEKRKRKEAEAA